MARPRTEKLPAGIIARTLKSGRVVYYATYQTAPGKQRQERSGYDLREAKALLAQRKREVREGSYLHAPGQRGRVTLASFVPTWIAWLRTSGKRAWADEERWMRLHILPRLGSRPIAELRPVDVMDFIATLRREGALSPKSIGNVHGSLSACLQYAVVREMILANPAARLPRGTLPTKRSVRDLGPWRPAEVATFLDDPRAPADRRVIHAIAAYTGARCGEVAGMRWRDLDTAAPGLWRWMLRTQYDGKPLKTDNPRDVPIHPRLRETLERWRAEGLPKLLCRDVRDSDFVVPRADGKCHSKNSIGGKDIDRRAPKLGIEVGDRDFHSFRRFFITQARTDNLRSDVVERITHNARGAMIDGYTYFEWPTLCETVLAMRWPNGGQAATPAPSVDPLAEAVAALERAGHHEAAELLRRLTPGRPAEHTD